MTDRITMHDRALPRRTFVRQAGAAGVAAALGAPFAVRAQAILLPLPRLGRHVHRDLKAQLRAHDADRQPQVAGGAHRDAVAAKERAQLGRGQLAVIVLNP